MQLTLVCLLAAPWGDGWSVDAAWRRWRGGTAVGVPSRRYGFAVWIPGFVFGVAFLAAAWSKVEDGPAWILNGTVRYHFVTDLNHALVSWGPWLTRDHRIAVALSAAAVVIEAALITASFTQSVILRLLLGLSAGSLLAGFALFQGLIWPAWWILLVSFLPWSWLRARHRAILPDVSLASRVQIFIVCALVLQQLVASVLHLEASPTTSTYGMYSATYKSEDEYEEKSNLRYQVVVRDATGDHEVPGCVLDDRIARQLRQAAAATGALNVASAVGRCAMPSGAEWLILRGDRRIYDWHAAQFWWRRGDDVIGPLQMATPWRPPGPARR